MLCPIDQSKLILSERQGIEIDYCPECRGVWLDRGELDKIVERSAQSQLAFNRYEQDSGQPERSSHGNDRYQDHDNGRNKYGKKRKRENFLSDLFDF